MPNHISNNIKFYGPKEEILKIMKQLDIESLVAGEPYVDLEIDFNKIIPEPITESECEKDFVIPEAKREKTTIRFGDDGPKRFLQNARGSIGTIGIAYTGELSGMLMKPAQG